MNTIEFNDIFDLHPFEREIVLAEEEDQESGHEETFFCGVCGQHLPMSEYDAHQSMHPRQ